MEATLMDCPRCGETLRYLGYVTKERDQRWWCKSCDVKWWHSHLQALKRQARRLEVTRQPMHEFVGQSDDE